MPYISTEDRNDWYRHLPRMQKDVSPEGLRSAIVEWLSLPALSYEDAGIATWGVCTLLGRYADRHPVCYMTFFECLIALEESSFEGQPATRRAWAGAVIASSRAEFYRRVVAPYERLKHRVNGDVFPESIVIANKEYD